MKFQAERVTTVTVSITGTPQEINLLHIVLARLAGRFTPGAPPPMAVIDTLKDDAVAVAHFASKLAEALAEDERGK